MAQVVITNKNLLATVDNLIANVSGFTGLSRAGAKKKLADRIIAVLEEKIKEHGEEKIFSPETAFFVWRGLYCFFSPVKEIYGAIETLSDIEGVSCEYVCVILYTALGD